VEGSCFPRPSDLSSAGFAAELIKNNQELDSDFSFRTVLVNDLELSKVAPPAVCGFKPNSKSAAILAAVTYRRASRFLLASSKLPPSRVQLAKLAKAALDQSIVAPDILRKARTLSHLTSIL